MNKKLFALLIVAILAIVSIGAVNAFDLGTLLGGGNTVTIEGLDKLKNKLIEMFNINEINKDLTYLSNARQIDLVNKASDSLKNANESLKNGIPIDMIESDLKACFEFLGQIIGDTYEQAVIDRLFRDFCVGK